MQAGNIILRAMIASQRKITVFLFAILTLVLIIGSLMYLIEGAENGFTNIPVSIYWTIVTLTTVGYGDIAPQTVLGKFFASIVMIMGYSIIAVPTGIVSAEMAIANRQKVTDAVLRTCHVCNRGDHDADAKYCSACGAAL
jgi:voltage-gated potassium channel